MIVAASVEGGKPVLAGFHEDIPVGARLSEADRYPRHLDDSNSMKTATAVIERARVAAVERLFEGEDHQHSVDVLPHKPDASLLPGPQLRGDKIEDRDSQPVKLPGQPEVHFGEVDEDGELRAPLADGLFEPRNRE